MPHPLRLEDAALRIDERQAFPLVDKTSLELLVAQRVMRLLQPLDMLESCPARRRIHRSDLE